MNISFYLFYALITFAYSLIPSWNIRTSAIDLLNGKDEHKYTIDHRNGWYGSCDHFEKNIKRNNGKITHYNLFVMKKENWGELLFENTVDFEAVESFYYDTHGKTFIPLVCPRGNYYPLKITSTTSFEEISYSDSNWHKTPKFDLKCYFHRSNDGHFLVYYLQNENIRFTNPLIYMKKQLYINNDTAAITAGTVTVSHSPGLKSSATVPDKAPVKQRTTDTGKETF